MNKPNGNHDPKALIGTFVGYQEQQLHGWKIYLPGSNEFIITAHVHFENDKYNNSEGMTCLKYMMNQRISNRF